MRDPAMHIKLTDFVDVLKAVGLPQPDILALSIFTQAVSYNIKDRYIVTGNAETRKKADKVIRSAKVASMTVERFNRLLDAERRAVGHRFITPIRRGTSAFTLLKEIALMACDFCNELGIDDIDDGCKTYIKLGLMFMKQGSMYGLNKFKYYDTKIYTLYESYDMITNDPNPKRTRAYHDMYVNLLAEYAAIERDLTQPADYVCFVYARLEGDKVKANIEDWLRAQFEELGKAFNSIPNPRQLFSEWALKRYYNYVGTSNKNLDEETEITLAYTNPTNDFERKYAEKLRLKNAEK